MESGNTKVLIGKVRASYAHVFVPTSFEEGGKKKYSVSLIIPKSDTALVEKIKAAISNALAIGKQSLWGGTIPRGLRDPLQDGDKMRPDDEAYADSYFVSAKSDHKVGVNKVKGRKMVEGKQKLILEEITDEEEFYSGCYVYASVNFYPYKTGGKGIAASLDNILKVEDGEPLSGGGASAESDFGDLDLPEEDMPFPAGADPFGQGGDECPY
jgi:Protein of unknown function (DUF2815).